MDLFNSGSVAFGGLGGDPVLNNFFFGFWAALRAFGL